MASTGELGKADRGVGISSSVGVLVVMAARTGRGVAGSSTSGLAVVVTAQAKSEYLGAVVSRNHASLF